MKENPPSKRNVIFLGNQTCYNHSIAKRCGLTAAIVFEKVRTLIKCVGVNSIFFHDGKSWERISVSFLADYFTYFSEREIREAIEILVKEEFLLVDTFSTGEIFYAVND